MRRGVVLDATGILGKLFKVVVGSLDCKDSFVALRVILFIVGLRLVVVDDRFRNL